MGRSLSYWLISEEIQETRGLPMLYTTGYPEQGKCKGGQNFTLGYPCQSLAPLLANITLWLFGIGFPFSCTTSIVHVWHQPPTLFHNVNCTCLASASDFVLCRLWHGLGVGVLWGQGVGHESHTDPEIPRTFFSNYLMRLCHWKIKIKIICYLKIGRESPIKTGGRVARVFS